MKQPTRKDLKETYERLLNATEAAGDTSANVFELLASVYDMPVEVVIEKLD